MTSLLPSLSCCARPSGVHEFFGNQLLPSCNVFVTFLIKVRRVFGLAWLPVCVRNKTYVMVQDHYLGLKTDVTFKTLNTDFKTMLAVT